MRLIRQVFLRKRQGRVERVYEIDLCEVGPDRCVVNFRHGKVGKPLSDGSRTVLPVPRARAEQIFDKLLREKLKKGFAEPGQTATATSPAAPPPPPQTARRTRPEVILGYLSAPATCRRGWPLRKVIWRAGELRLRAATPHLIRHLDTREPLQAWSAAWALGRCADPTAHPAARRALLRVARNRSRAAPLRHIAWESARLLSNPAERASLTAMQLRELPPDLALAVDGRDLAEITAVLDGWYEGRDSALGPALATLYRIDDARPALVEFLARVPFRPPAFQGIRRVFKAAELRADGEMFGLLARRFALERPARGKAWSRGTRTWFRRRVWRTLRRLGQLEDPAYVELAAGVLSAFSGADAQPYTQQRWNPRTRQYYSEQWYPYRRFWALGKILRCRDRSLRSAHSRLRWHGLATADDAPLGDHRPEAFPHLWDRAPHVLTRLLTTSRCRPVHRFAARALRANRGGWSAASVDDLRAWLENPHPHTAALGADIALARYRPRRPDVPLAVALANSPFERARRHAHRWIRESRAVFLTDTSTLAALALSPQADTRALMRDLLSSTFLPDSAQDALIAACITHLRARSDTALGWDLSTLLLTVFARRVRDLPLERVRELIGAENEALQRLGADILMAHSVRPAELPDDLLAAVMTAPHASVRGVGIRLFGELPDHVLMTRFMVLSSLCTSTLADVRTAVRPVIQRLAEQHPDFGVWFTSELITTLCEEESAAEMHADLAHLLRHELGRSLHAIDSQTVWHLLQASSPAARDLGGELMVSNLDPADLSMRQISDLGSNPLLAVRESVWAMFRADVPRIRRELPGAVRLLDAAWEDSRRFGFEFFAVQIPLEDWTISLLVAICDSIRPDVQRFGSGLILRALQDVDGPELMLKLSQHPSAGMRLFVTNFLETHAAGHPERLAALEPYFLTVLRGVGRGRVARERVFAFLRAEAARSPEAAALVGRLMTATCGTVAIGARARAIEILLEVHQRSPELALPVEIRPPRQRSPRQNPPRRSPARRGPPHGRSGHAV